MDKRSRRKCAMALSVWLEMRNQRTQESISEKAQFWMIGLAVIAESYAIPDFGVDGE